MNNQPDRGARVAVIYARGGVRDARRLAGALNGYRPPAALQDLPTASGFTPSRLTAEVLPTPRNDAEIDLPTESRDALRAADHLVALCSEAAAEDRWMDEQIRTFLAYRRMENQNDRLHLAVMPGGSEQRLPAAAQETGVLPAADLRLEQDGWGDGVQKLRAALLGAPLDQLRRLERGRSALRLRAALAVLAALATAGGVAASYAWG